MRRGAGAPPLDAARAIAAAVAMTVLLSAAGCGGANDEAGGDQPAGQFAGDDQSGGGGAPNANPADLTIQNFAFSPADLTEPAGETIAVENKDTTQHTFTVDGEKIDVDVDPGDEVDVALDLDPGSYDFHCSIHPDMKGTLTLS
jgi:plastocyanin